MESLNHQSSTVLDGLHLFVKRDCPTCQLIEPSIYQLAKESEQLVAIYVQDDPTILAGLNAVKDDTTLEQSHHFQIETVPTLVRIKNGQEISRAIGWHRSDWQDVNRSGFYWRGAPGTVAGLWFLVGRSGSCGGSTGTIWGISF